MQTLKAQDLVVGEYYDIKNNYASKGVTPPPVYEKAELIEAGPDLLTFKLDRDRHLTIEPDSIHERREFTVQGVLYATGFEITKSEESKALTGSRDYVVVTHKTYIPDYRAELVSETDKTITVKLTGVIATPKTIGDSTHTFTSTEEEYFSERIGRNKTFWKETGQEIGGLFILKTN